MGISSKSLDDGVRIVSFRLSCSRRAPFETRESRSRTANRTESALCLCRVVGTATMPTPCSTHKKRTTVDSTQMEQKPERGRPETMFAQGKLTGLVQRSNCN